MSKEVQQFIEMIREELYLIEYGKLERQEILLNIAEGVLDGKITPEEAEELRDILK